MHLLHFTQQFPSAIQHAVYGSFSAPLAQELVVARGRFIELLVLDEGRFVRSVRLDCFAHIRGLATIRLAGQSKDCLVVSSDSGKLTFLSVHNGAFKREACETYGKWSMRRVVPGQFMATDPKGRAVMLAAMEKDKLVFMVNRDAENKLIVSSPLEANKQHAVVFCIVGLDVGYENPMFAAIEVIYDDGERASKDHSTPAAGLDGDKEVVFYELDLGVNHVTRKSAVKVDSSAHFLVAAPGGVLVCSQDTLTFVRRPMPNEERKEPERVSLPRRRNESEPVMCVAQASFAAGKDFFALVQTERGDLFKVVVDHPEKGPLHVKYFDTVPVSVQLCITLRGLLFVASEVGDHELYQFRSVGDDPDDDGVESKAGETPRLFTPRQQLRNLDSFDSLRSLAPLSGMQIEDLAREDVPQLYCSSGTGSRSTMRVLRQGLSVVELASTKLLHLPKGVWTVRDDSKDQDRLIVVSYPDETQVLSIENNNVLDIKTSGLTLDASTIFASAWTNKQMLQVTQRGFYRLDTASGKPLQEPWKLHGHKLVECASVNPSGQMALALTGGEVIYFEADASGSPGEVGRYDNGVGIVAMDLGASKSRFLVLGSADKQVKVMSLDRATLMVPLSTQLLPERAASVCLGLSTSINDPARVEIGLTNGLLVRSMLDGTGVIVDTRTHVLGSRQVRCQRVRHSDGQLTLCCTSRPWLARGNALSPLSFVGVDFAAPFASEHARDGLLAVSGRTLRVVTIESDFDMRFNEQARQLAYTPRRFVVHPSKKFLIILEGEHKSQSVDQRRGRAERREKRAKTSSTGAGAASKTTDMDLDEEVPDDGLPTSAEKQIGYARNPEGWTGLIRVLDPALNKTMHVAYLKPDEVGISIELCTFASHPDVTFVAVGTVTGLNLHAVQNQESFKKASIRLYRLTEDKLEHHKHDSGECITDVKGLPRSLCAFDGQLLAGVGNDLVLYRLGQKQLLSTCFLKNFNHQLAFIKVIGAERIVVGDASDSCFFVTYSRADNSFNVFADDVTNRLVTVADMVDYNTVAAGDKNGNVFVLRLPPGATGEDVKSRAAAQRPNLWDQSPTAAVPHKLDLIAHFYVGEAITGLRKVQLSLGHSETLVYSTVSGTIGTLCPFPSRDDLDFFAHLELHMRKQALSIVGRDHLQFRSYYAPCKQVVDGDLCEMFAKLDVATQSKIAKELDRTPLEVMKRIEDARALVLW